MAYYGKIDVSLDVCKHQTTRECVNTYIQLRIDKHVMFFTISSVAPRRSNAARRIEFRACCITLYNSCLLYKVNMSICCERRLRKRKKKQKAKYTRRFIAPYRAAVHGGNNISKADIFLHIKNTKKKTYKKYICIWKMQFQLCQCCKIYFQFTDAA